MSEPVQNNDVSNVTQRPDGGQQEPEPRPLKQKGLKLTQEQREERARKAAEARWGKINWETLPLDEAQRLLQDLRVETERAGGIIQQRLSEAQGAKVKCSNPDCDHVIDLVNGRAAGQRSYVESSTGLIKTVYACSAACWLLVQRLFQHPRSNPNQEVVQP